MAELLERGYRVCLEKERIAPSLGKYRLWVMRDPMNHGVPLRRMKDTHLETHFISIDSLDDVEDACHQFAWNPTGKQKYRVERFDQEKMFR